MSDPWGAAPQQDAWGSAAPNGEQWGSTPAQPAQAAAEEPPSLEEALDRSSTRSFSFDGPVGTTADGIITEIPKAQQKRDYDTKELLTWQDGKPKWVYPVLIQTSLHEDDDDDGIRGLYFEYKKLDALRDALKAANAKLEVGGRLAMRYVSGGPKDRSPGATKHKQYAVKYWPPNSQEAQAARQAPPAAPVQQAPPPQQQAANDVPF